MTLKQAAPGLLSLLERQRDDGYLQLRFFPELESAFRADYAQSIAPQRVILLVSAIVLIASTPLMERWLLHPPAAFTGPTRWMQFGIMIPALLAALVATLAPSLRRMAEPLALAATLAVAGGVLFQRALGTALGFHVPAELVGVVLAGTAILSGFRAVHFAPLAVLILALFIGVELRTHPAPGAVRYTNFAMGMLTLICVLGSYLQELVARGVWLQRKLLEELALQDPLTGLSNLRGFQLAFRSVFGAAARDRKPLLVAAIDIDHFKPYNDFYGHLSGDVCLRRVAEILARHTRRATDIRARTGGEEFVLVCYDVAPKEAEPLLQAVRADVEAMQIPHAASADPGQRVTISIGAACLTPEPRTRPEQLLQAADNQLYLSKQAGRNRVSLQTAVEPPERAERRTPGSE